jgi:alkyl hydroperoxide reductase subunit AhpF
MSEKTGMKISFCCEGMKDYVRNGSFNVGTDHGELTVEIAGEHEEIGIDYCPFCGRPVLDPKRKA